MSVLRIVYPVQETAQLRAGERRLSCDENQGGPKRPFPLYRTYNIQYHITNARKDRLAAA